MVPDFDIDLAIKRRVSAPHGILVGAGGDVPTVVIRRNRPCSMPSEVIELKQEYHSQLWSRINAKRPEIAVGS